jgi:tetratricopeptide (TPR) repeat protein
MEMLLGFLILGLFIALIVGLVNPSLILRWSKKPTRLKVFVWWFFTTFVLSILCTALITEKTSEEIVNSSKEKIENRHYKSAINELKKIKQDDSFYNESQLLIAKADSLQKITKNEKRDILKNSKEDSIRLENQRKDSITFYISKAEQFTINKKYQLAIDSYSKALDFSPENKNQIQFSIADLYYQLKKYNAAIDKYEELKHINFGDTVFYQLALCYVGLSDKVNAVQYLRYAMNINSERANKLHDKINPIKKRIVGYTTLCCDGTTSKSKGRGACSKHGGVCNWNHPIYVEYREY